MGGERLVAPMAAPGSNVPAEASRNNAPRFLRVGANLSEAGREFRSHVPLSRAPRRCGGPRGQSGRPLSTQGLEAANRLAAEAAARAAKPAVVWHSGKLRARQTAEAFWSACNPRAEFAAARDLSPDNPPSPLRDRLRGETRDILIAGHFPHLPRLLTLLLGGAADAPAAFPLHGVVALESLDEGETWVERWRLGPAS